MDKRLEIRKRVSTSNVLFGRVCLPQLFYLPPSQVHHDIDHVLTDKGIQFAVFRVPRFHAKSTLISNSFPLQETLSGAVLEGRKEFVLLISKTTGTSDELLNTIKFELEYNRKIKEIYGEWGSKTAKVWTKSRIVLKNDTVILSRGLGQQVIGLRHLELRPTIAVVDDPEDRDNIKTEKAMSDHMRWLLGELVPAMDPVRGRVLVVGTPKHELCMVERLSTTRGWYSLGRDSIVDEANKIMLWPEQWSWDKLMRRMDEMRSAGQLRLFYSEYRCKIVGSEEQLFRPEYFRFYEGDVKRDELGNAFLHIRKMGRNEDELDTLPTVDVRPVNLFMGVDPASSLEEGRAYSAIVTVAVDEFMNWFIRPYFRKRVTPMTLVDEIVARYAVDQPELTSIEEIGYQTMIKDYLMSLEGVFIAGLGHKNITQEQKDRRLERMEPNFAKGQVYMLPGMSELKDELLLFPRATTKDLMDALWWATKRTYPPSISTPMVETTTKRERKLKRLGRTDPDSWMIA